jgi:hypothetical protein
MATTLAERVAELEKDVAELKKMTAGSNAGSPADLGSASWRSTVGAFKDDPFYDDMVRIGRSYRRRQPKC